MAGLAAPLHRGLALALALAADCLREGDQARQYVHHMLGAVARELAGLAGGRGLSVRCLFACMQKVLHVRRPELGSAGTAALPMLLCMQQV